MYRSRLRKKLDDITLNYVSSISDDSAIAFYDIIGSEAHVIMLYENKLLTKKELKSIISSILFKNSGKKYILRRSKKTNEEIANFFDNLKEENRSSYLIEITSKILRQKKDEVYVLDEIKPFASNKGTGKLTVETSLNLKVPTPSIYAAYDARVQSNNKNDWDEINMESEVTSEEDLSNCLYFGRVASMIQGLELIAKPMVNINFGTVLNNWMGGCIIRSNLLKELNVVSSASKDFLGDLKLNKIFKDNLVSTKKIISEAVLNDISIPVLSASLNWYLNLSSSSNPSNLIQAQRDFFGRHKVQLVDSEEDVNIDWD